MRTQLFRGNGTQAFAVSAQHHYSKATLTALQQKQQQQQHVSVVSFRIMSLIYNAQFVTVTLLTTCLVYLHSWRSISDRDWGMYLLLCPAVDRSRHPRYITL